MIKIIRKILCFFTIALVVSFITLNVDVSKANASSYFGYDFSNITEEESIDFVERHNIDAPTILLNSSIYGKTTKEIIQLSASNPNYVLVYNYGKMQLYANTIQKLVNKYNENSSIATTSLLTYNLRYNTVKDENGNWVTSGGAYDQRWENYNCYAYSINRIEQPQYYQSAPFVQYQPGDMSEKGSFDTTETIQELAELVMEDLLAIGYSNVNLSTTIPTITENQELICLRKTTLDYHFMRYDIETNAWYHKPGTTAVLKYSYTPSNDRLWYGEYSKNGVEGCDFTLTYDSDIYFIKYNKNKIDISTESYLCYLNINSGKDSILELGSIVTNKTFKFNLSSTNSFAAELYDNEMELITSYSGTNIQFYRTLSNDVYYLKVNFLNESASGSVNVSISYHTHSYTYVSCGDGKYHSKQCSCGYSARELCAGLFNGIATLCIKCNQEIDDGGGSILLSIDSNEKILPTKESLFLEIK